MALDWLLAEHAIDENESLTGPGVIFSLTHATTWESGLSLAAFALNILLADCVVVSDVISWIFWRP
jgi:hypothetical protein